ncbi:hypothetical protein CRYUN_Cryun06bG0117600 [Craigia yunnanensis]
MGKEIALTTVGMVMAECVQVGLMILGKAAMSHGMSNFVFVFYSNALASLILLPSSFLFHRSERPPLTFSIIFGYAGIYYSSPTLGTATLNLIPGLTFILAVDFRMEKLLLRSSSRQAKSLGTIASIVGAFIVEFSSVYVYRKLKQYCFIVTLQTAIVCLVMERDFSAWSFKLDVILVAVLYSAVFGSVFQLGVSTWCLHRRWPVFVSIFKPLEIIISVVMGVVFLGDTFCLGR